MTNDEIHEIRAKIHEHMNAGWDMYTATVAANVGKSPEDVTTQEREAIKALAFADNYGYKGTGLLEKLLERQSTPKNVTALWSNLIEKVRKRPEAKTVTFTPPNYMIQAEEARRSMQIMRSRRCEKHDEPIEIEIHGDAYCKECLAEKGWTVDG